MQKSINKYKLSNRHVTMCCCLRSLTGGSKKEHAGGRWETIIIVASHDLMYYCFKPTTDSYQRVSHHPETSK